MEIVEKKDKELADLQISISHAITRASHGLTLVEKRIICLFIAKFDNHKHQKLMGRVIPAPNSTIRITAKEYSETFDVDIGSSYRELRKGADKFFERYWRVIQETPKGKKEFKYNWLEGVTYHHGEGWVEATFGQKTIPHLVFNLKEKYTKYKLKSTIALTSGYAWRLWELMAQFANTKKPQEEERLIRISLKEFCYAMEVPESYKYSQIRQKVIEPSIEQIKKHNEITVTWRAIKKGRSVDSLEFKFKPCNQLNLF
jgi:plasmid replication initiation protein|tara:strand:- start:377 stop:1147 length:771 start_codon:yes stop_codon:yes gene_type:complete